MATLTVTSGDIEDAVRRRSLADTGLYEYNPFQECPVALALSREYGGTFTVGGTAIYSMMGLVIPILEDMAEYIKRFDLEEPIEPTMFTLSEPL